MVGVLVVGVIVLGVQGFRLVAAIRHQQTTTAPILASTQKTSHDAAHTARLVKSCVDPDGKCFQDGQKRTADAIGSINRNIIASAACAGQIVRHHPNAKPKALTARITTCVVQQIAPTQ